jgi:uncharacterized membrane protein YozB (DUF420 family)
MTLAAVLGLAAVPVMVTVLVLRQPGSLADKANLTTVIGNIVTTVAMALSGIHFVLQIWQKQRGWPALFPDEHPRRRDRRPARPSRRRRGQPGHTVRRRERVRVPVAGWQATVRRAAAQPWVFITAAVAGLAVDAALTLLHRGPSQAGTTAVITAVVGYSLCLATEVVFSGPGSERVTPR